VKVNEVEGERFDVYAAGAVLFSVIENSFPAHGGLSQVAQPCPEAARWIIRRAMADYDKRYPSAGAMLADVEALLAADDPFALKPADLPSMRGHASTAAAATEDRPADAPPAAHAHAGGPQAPPASPVGAAQPAEGPAQRPIRLRVTNWWTGAFKVEHAPARAPERAVPVDVAAPSPRVMHAATPGAPRRPAAEQLASARARAREAQRRAHGRSRGRSAGHAARAGGRPRASTGGGGGALGIALASLIVLAPVVGVAVLVLGLASEAPVRVDTPAPPASPASPQSAATRHPSLGDRPRIALSTGSEVVDRAIRVIRQHEPGKPMDGTLLVVRDAMALRPELGGRIEARLAALRQAGVTVLDTHDYAQGEGDRVTELLADLRRTMGLSDISSRRGRALLDAWLAREQGVHGVYWILPDEHDAAGARALLAFRGERGQRMARAIEHLP